jgi:hypothetical protein
VTVRSGRRQELLVDQMQSIACAPANDNNLFVGMSFSIVSAIITALLAPSRGRSGFWWFLIGGFLPWISLLVLYLLADLSGEPANRAFAVEVRSAPTPPSEPAMALPEDGWFYALRRQPMGPVSLQYLRGAIRAGSLSGNVPVWCAAFRDWVTPNRIPGFFG